MELARRSEQDLGDDMDTSSDRGSMPVHGDVPATLEQQDQAAEVRISRQIRPGYIIRDENFDQLRAKADAFTGTQYNKALIAAAARSLSGITPTEKLLLLEAIDMQDRAVLTSPDAGIIWARNRVFAERLGISLDAVKSARRGLEYKGIAIRHPAIDNNATRFDIRPFLADLDRYLDDRYGIDVRRRAADKLGDQSEFLDGESHPQGEIFPSHIQSSSSNEVESVQTSAKADDTAAPRFNQRGRRPTGADSPGPTWRNHQQNRSGTTVICSAGRASVSDGGKISGNLPAESARGALLAAWEASPRWQALVDRGAVERLVYDDLFASALTLINTHFPERQRNHEKTWTWAVSKYHWRAIVMAVVSIEDPSVRQPHKYFGWLATKAQGVDLADNLDYLVRHRAELDRRVAAELDEPDDDLVEADASGTTEAAAQNEPEVANSGPSGESEAPIDVEEPLVPTPGDWERFRAELKRAAPVTAWRYWLEPIKFIAITDGLLKLEAPSKMSAEWAENSCGTIILQAARRLGWPVNLLMIKPPS